LKILNIQNLNFSFGDKKIFNNFNLKISEYEAICIVGESGSGKSTLLEIISGSLKQDSGSIDVCNIAQVFQDPYHSFAHSYSILNQIQDVAKIDIDEMLELMKLLKLDVALMDKKPFELSGGQLQRFSIIRALLMKPKLLLADEPTSALDNVVTMELMLFLVSRLKDMAIILITHDDDLAKWFGDKIIKTKEFT